MAYHVLRLNFLFSLPLKHRKGGLGLPLHPLRVLYAMNWRWVKEIENRVMVVLIISCS